MLGKYVTIVNPRGCVVVIDARDTRSSSISSIHI